MVEAGTPSDDAREMKMLMQLEACDDVKVIEHGNASGSGRSQNASLQSGPPEVRPPPLIRTL